MGCRCRQLLLRRRPLLNQAEGRRVGQAAQARESGWVWESRG